MAWQRLSTTGMYDHNLTLNMIDCMMYAGGEASTKDIEEFRFPIRSVRQELNKKLLAIRHMSYDEANKAMTKDRLDVKSVLSDIESSYRVMRDKKCWHGLKDTKDSKAMVRNYGSVNAAVREAKTEDTKTLTKLVRTLVQSMQGRDKSNDNCNNCGRKGHWMN